MKNLLILATSVLIISTACNNASDTKEVAAKAHADSLMDAVMQGHNEAMAGTNKISSAQKRVKQSLDSVEKLSPKQKEVSAGFKNRLDSLSASLQAAASGMDKWMEEFNMDSAKNDQELRARYLETEKEKVELLKEAMGSVLRKTDSLLKK